uniref:Protease Do-like PDZ domain-containing protein n=1 Tax=Chromera velia CCMP2878 TaxID=1169474 RepID=A0A0G4I4S4_9ALVE|eukprot:Cvel_10950.t1-p1 / transcript=Cvel_10950.t1 / gene=Cvel_10950 / organism=Chromera_velia_CCMP2878 / gene_product=Protease Do-like 9, putative / transcript_product=Protease Do-like 9, putative / location=Cvel_scaffold673:40298-45893(+) / protein_length=632 / sequence_SO=supercontig / SO=protein_coding / is_pseudo=false
MTSTLGRFGLRPPSRLLSAFHPVKSVNDLRPSPGFLWRSRRHGGGPRCLTTLHSEGNSSEASQQVEGAPKPQQFLAETGQQTETEDFRHSTDGMPMPHQTSHLSPTALSQKCFNSVVKIYTDYTDPNFAQPWQMRRQARSTGSGFAISGKLIMTNAHVVSYSSRVLVRKHGSAKKYLAKVVATGHECDLAVLSVEDDEFWTDLECLEFGGLPRLQDAVTVVGYPTGGDNLCITAGVVSRLDVSSYVHSNFRLLCAQIDAAINPGNSGGPAFKGEKVVGVAFQGNEDAQNIGYVIPIPVVQHFLEDIKRHGGKPVGFVTLGITYQTLENACMREFIGIDEIPAAELPEGISRTGILVVSSDPLRSLKGELHKKGADPTREETREDVVEMEAAFSEEKRAKVQDSYLLSNDVILAIDGIDVADDGTIPFRQLERVHMAFAVAQKFPGDTCRLTILRNRKVIELELPVCVPTFLVPEQMWDKKPRFYIFGGLVFTPLTIDYLKDEYGKKYYERAPWTMMQPITELFQRQHREEIVILSQVLASDLTIGYELRNSRLHTVNGIRVKNLRHLSFLLEETVEAAQKKMKEGKPEDFISFKFDHDMQVVLKASKAAELNEAILKQHNIPTHSSLSAESG